MNTRYSKAYTEVLEILKYLPEEELSRIPDEKINFFESNKDSSYNFELYPEISFEEQNISIEANSVIVLLFRDYFATENQKEQLQKVLEKNSNKKN